MVHVCKVVSTYRQLNRWCKTRTSKGINVSLVCHREELFDDFFFRD